MKGSMAGVALAGAILAITPLSSASFGASAPVGPNTFSTATIAPATNLAGSWLCVRPLGYTLTLTWTASPSPFTREYLVESSPSAGGPWTLEGISVGTTALLTGLARKTTGWYRVTSVAYLWTSSPVATSLTSPNPSC